MAAASISGGGKLDAFLAQVENALDRASLVKIGFFEGATYPDGTPVAQVAFWDEYGTKHSPPRPYFRRMIAAHSSEWGPALAKIAKANNYDMEVCLGLMGEGIKDQLVTSIVEFTTPGNAPSTIKRKGFDKPLDHTGVMIRSPSYEVET